MDTSPPVIQKRFCGVLAHPTSFPGPYGIGDLGDGAYRFVDFLHQAGQNIWQILPLGPTGYGDSPYACFSAFAGNPLLISLDWLADHDLLSPADLARVPAFPRDRVDFGPVINYHAAMLDRAFRRFDSLDRHPLASSFDQFCSTVAWWLDDYALFMACKDANGGAVWNQWSSGKGALFCDPDPSIPERCSYHKFVQFLFFTQWQAVKHYANDRGIRIIGDIPIFVAYDSADVWAHPHLFKLDSNGCMTVVAGVPPDLFSKTGQRWGNPLYRWDECRKHDFSWWLSRLSWNLETVDLIRVDHFRGFVACWEIPADAETAEIGEWVPCNGRDLFAVIQKKLGSVPIIAEDLGVITPAVDALRNDFNLPGMKILQFAFGDAPDNVYLPHNYTPDCVVYTGSHDNDTTAGWYAAAPEKVRDHIRRYLGIDGNDIVWDMIRLAYASVADYAIIPLQDIFGLDSSARMNFPGTTGSNWAWRYTDTLLDTSTAARLNDLALLYGRRPPVKQPSKHNS